MRIGFGYDVHRLVEGRPLIIGGVEIPHTHGLLGHSDADVLIHAICDAILGAAGLRDIGYYFPDNNDNFKNADSKVLLARSLELVEKEGYTVGNIDTTICAERPKLNPHIEAMKQTLAPILKVSVKDVGIKATTNETIGFVGRCEGIVAYAVALIKKCEC
ncbi:MAG: 2-C-methyl-D-erythritol 2,4-cyclodiphosphate synthase [Porphyromonadaceae bacterium]|nr:2-C-methyl-D-erythritol 2,4-cyclodiphosphate synthase [Porphyromonadaceae bacterium]